MSNVKTPDTLDEATAHIQYLVIQAIQGYLLDMEMKGRIVGNSQHVTQVLARQAAWEVTQRWQGSPKGAPLMTHPINPHDALAEGKE